MRGRSPRTSFQPVIVFQILSNPLPDAFKAVPAARGEVWWTVEPESLSQGRRGERRRRLKKNCGAASCSQPLRLGRGENRAPLQVPCSAVLPGVVTSERSIQPPVLNVISVKWFMPITNKLAHARVRLYKAGRSNGASGTTTYYEECISTKYTRAR